MTTLLVGTAKAAHEVVESLMTLTRARVVRVRLGRSEAVLAGFAEATAACRNSRRRSVLLVHVDAVDVVGMAHEPSRAALVGLLEQAGAGVIVVGTTDAPLAIDRGILSRFGRVVRIRRRGSDTHTIH